MPAVYSHEIAPQAKMFVAQRRDTSQPASQPVSLFKPRQGLPVSHEDLESQA